jgi:excisionase family DNA binding protein
MGSPISNDKFLTVSEVSNLLRLSVLTIYKYIREGKLTAFDFGGHYRISDQSLNEFINSHRTDHKEESENG